MCYVMVVYELKALSVPSSCQLLYQQSQSQTHFDQLLNAVNCLPVGIEPEIPKGCEPGHDHEFDLAVERRLKDIIYGNAMVVRI